MDGELLEIQPSELKFKFEPKKHILCSVRLINNSDHHVAFKVKTTVPKIYHVRPNMGVIGPKSHCDLKITRHAETVAPFPEVVMSKEKFMFQSTIVPEGMTSKQITSDTHTKDGKKHVEEKKVKVVLVQMTEEEKIMRAKVEELEVRLKKAELDIQKLKKENKLANQEQIRLDQQLKALKNKKSQVKCFNLKLFPSKAF